MPLLDPRDVERYFNGTFVRKHSNNKLYNVANVGLENVVLQDKEKNRVKVQLDDFPVEFDLSMMELGYFSIGDTVIYLSNKQNNSPIKAVHHANIIYWFPQEDEYKKLRKAIPPFLMYDLLDREITPLEGVLAALETKDAVVVHKNFAVVKKGFCEYPVVYHRQFPAAMLTKDGMIPFEDKDKVYIEKLLLEISGG